MCEVSESIGNTEVTLTGHENISQVLDHTEKIGARVLWVGNGEAFLPVSLTVHWNFDIGTRRVVGLEFRDEGRVSLTISLFEGYITIYDSMNEVGLVVCRGDSWFSYPMYYNEMQEIGQRVMEMNAK